MKAISVILLSLVILLQPLSKLVLVAEYQVNKNYIAEFLCVNKSKPQLQCEGKCLLSKQLRSADQHEKDHPVSAKEKLAEVLYFCQASPGFSFPFPTVLQTISPLVSQPKINPPVFGIFHPPKFLV